ncbi:MAG: hypothetical protein HOU81_16570 [Hamadaea sp.]|uniref:hypothetical protein n=1 Tax=Hamadaea sp. TaxID=2024425 RepID=UPI0017F4F3F4|nr:hypothetical protein [Hamadaea sp.]NUR72431.1 hypothetical protein [Hamadaea sp.]NUT19956.1 hypothetical protein [Hamadaea sp.]
MDDDERAEFGVRYAGTLWWTGFATFILGTLVRVDVLGPHPIWLILIPASLITNIAACIAMSWAGPIAEERFPFRIPARGGDTISGFAFPVGLAIASGLLLLSGLNQS